MKKKDIFFSVYIKNNLENDIEIVSTFDNMSELKNFMNVSKRYLYSLGISKTKDLRVNIKIKDVEYLVIVDED